MMAQGCCFFNLLYGFIWRPIQIKLLCESQFILAVGVFLRKSLLRILAQNGHYLVLISSPDLCLSHIVPGQPEISSF